MKAKSRSSSSAFAARSGTWSSSTALPPPGARRVPLALLGGVDTADEAGRALAEGQLVAALYPLAVYGRAVEQGAVGRAEVLDDVAVVGAREPRVLPRDVRVGDDDVVLLRAADGPGAAPLQREAPVLRHYLDDLAREPVPLGLLGRDGRGALRHAAGLLGAEDAGLARGVLGGALLARAVPAGQLGRDAELAEAQGVLGLEADPGRGHQMVVLVLRVRGGVLDQLVPQGVLVGPDGLGVLLGEVHREVVGGVGTRDAHHPALVHLLGQGLGDLHRVDLAPESTPEDALYERLHPLLDVLEDAQKILTLSPSQRGTSVPRTL